MLNCLEDNNNCFMFVGIWFINAFNFHSLCCAVFKLDNDYYLKDQRNWYIYRKLCMDYDLILFIIILQRIQPVKLIKGSDKYILCYILNPINHEMAIIKKNRLNHKKPSITHQ